MKKTIFSALCVIMMALCTTTTATAQPDCKPNLSQEELQKKAEKRGQMAEAHAKHIASQLALDDATTKKFVATFTEYQKEMWAMKKDIRPEKPKELTEAEAEQDIKQQMERKRKMLDLREKYYKKYSQFLSQKQIQRVYEIEKKDMERLKAGNGKHGGMGKHGGNGKHGGYGKPCKDGKTCKDQKSCKDGKPCPGNGCTHPQHQNS